MTKLQYFTLTHPPIIIGIEKSVSNRYLCYCLLLQALDFRLANVFTAFVSMVAGVILGNDETLKNDPLNLSVDKIISRKADNSLKR